MIRAFSLAVLALGLGAAAAVVRSDRERDGLKGPVHSVATRWQANHKDEYGEVEERELGSVTYDAAGNLIERRDITPDFIADRKVEHVDRRTAVFRSVMGNSVEHYGFDGSGNLIELRRWYGDKAAGPPSIIERMRYDPAAQLVRVDVFDGNDKLLSSTRYTNGTDGVPVIEEERNVGAKPPFPRMHYTYTFDAHGNWTARFVTRENVPEDAYDYRYAGNLFRTITYY